MAAAEIEGHCAPRFAPVQEAFTNNFERGLEVGASFSVVQDGERVVDLWGGHRDRARSLPWAQDTLVNVWSSTKGMAATCDALLVGRGVLDYEVPVADYWPEFADAGKAQLTVGQALSHQAGLSGLRDPIEARAYADWDDICRRLAAQEPFFGPGRSGYHAITFGFLAGELVRRVTGKSLGTFFSEQVAGPLGAAFFIGLPESEEGRVAEMLAPREEPEMPPPEHPAAVAALTNPPMEPELPNERWWRAAEIPGANGQGNAHGLATVYGMLARGGEWNGEKLVAPDAIAAATRCRVESTDLVLAMPMRWGAGYVLNDGVTYGPNRSTFGHSGWGGSFGCADPDAKLGIGYAMNQMDPNLQGDPRPLALLEAVYGCL